MKKYEFVKVEVGGIIDHVLKHHQEIINDYASRGYKYAGYLPTKTTASGGLLEIELIFENEY